MRIGQVFEEFPPLLAIERLSEEHTKPHFTNETVHLFP